MVVAVVVAVVLGAVVAVVAGGGDSRRPVGPAVRALTVQEETAARLQVAYGEAIALSGPVANPAGTARVDAEWRADAAWIAAAWPAESSGPSSRLLEQIVGDLNAGVSLDMYGTVQPPQAAAHLLCDDTLGGGWPVTCSTGTDGG